MRQKVAFVVKVSLLSLLSRMTEFSPIRITRFASTVLMPKSQVGSYAACSRTQRRVISASLLSPGAHQFSLDRNRVPKEVENWAVCINRHRQLLIPTGVLWPA